MYISYREAAETKAHMLAEEVVPTISPPTEKKCKALYSESIKCAGCSVYGEVEWRGRVGEWSIYHRYDVIVQGV